ncbi:MAG: acyl carrier protein [Cyanobacteria bacterium P01_F01_bin.13]
MTAIQPKPTAPHQSPNYPPVIQAYISDVLLNGRMQVEPDDDLLVGEILDSLGMMRLVAFIEETFEIKVPLEDITIQNFRTIEAIDEYLTRRTGHGAG